MLFKSFKEYYVFNKYKDRCFINSKSLKGDMYKKYKKFDIDIDAMYIRITNYQIEKYGGILRVSRTVKNGKEGII